MLKSVRSCRDWLCEARYAATRSSFAVGGSSTAKSVVLVLFRPAVAFVGVVADGFLGEPVGVLVAGLMPVDSVAAFEETIPGASTDSSCSHTRAATSSLLNSFVLCVPAAMGAVNRGHRVVLACLSDGSVREAARVSESWTAATKRA